MSPKKNKISNILLNTSVGILTAMALMFILSFCGFIFKIPINIVYPVLSIFSGFLVFIYRCIKIDEISPKTTLIVFLCVIAIIKVFVNIMTNYWDSSYDGRVYHQSSIIFLNMGWNPIYQNINNFAENFGCKITQLIWCENYPKFSEIIAANIYKLTSNIETGKIINILSASSLFLYIFSILNKTILKEHKLFTKLIISFLFIYNPIYLSQLFTYYTDGLLYIYFLFLLFSIIDIEYDENISKINAFILAFSILALVNIKISGLLYSILICTLYLIYLFIKKKKYINYFIKIIIVTTFLSFISLINPYVVNTIKGRTPFYPLTGKNKIDDVVSYNMPVELKNKNIFEKFFYSTFAKTDSHTKKMSLKIPMTFDIYEIHHFGAPDTRINGFGIFFSGIFLLSLLQLFFLKLKNKKDKSIFCLISIIIFLSVILNPHNWWARYIPQFWALIIFINLFCLSKTNKLALNIKYLSYTVLFISFLNSFIVNVASFGNCVLYTGDKKRLLSYTIAENRQKELLLYAKDGFREPSYLVLLKKNNIKYRFVDDEFYKNNQAEFRFNPMALEKEELKWNY